MPVQLGDYYSGVAESSVCVYQSTRC